jgi:rhamnose transport system permease protein
MQTIRRYLRPEQIRELSLAVIILTVVVFFATQVENYVSGRFFNRVSIGVAIVAIVAAGQALVIITRNIDLSVGSIVGVGAYVVGQFLSANPDAHPFVALLMALGLGGLLGLINGLLIAYGRVPAIIVTLGTMAMYRTFLIEYANAQTVTTEMLPEWAVNMPQATVFAAGDYDLRVLFAIAVGVILLLQVALTYLPWGRRLYAIGSNPEAARMAGLPVERITLVAYVACGALAGVGGFMYLGRYGTITVLAGQGLELSAIAAAVVGGVSTLGGSGTLLGALLGAVLVDLLDQSLGRWRAISEFWRDAVLGGLIFLAVASDLVILNRLRRLWATPAAQPRVDLAEQRHG